MKNLGLAVIAIGVLMTLASFGYDTAPEGTHNIGLLQKQMMFFQLGGGLTIIGTLLLSAGFVLKRLEDAGLLPPAGVISPILTPKAD